MAVFFFGCLPSVNQVRTGTSLDQTSHSSLSLPLSRFRFPLVDGTERDVYGNVMEDEKTFLFVFNGKERQVNLLCLTFAFTGVCLIPVEFRQVSSSIIMIG